MTKTMTFAEFRAVNIKRLLSTPKYEKCVKWSAADWCLAMIGEAGELANAIKKFNRGDYGGAELHTEIKKEVADILTYADLTLWSIGADLDEAAVLKFNEISQRVNSSVFMNLNVSPAMQDIIAERERQHHGEFFSDEHDDEYAPGVLSIAAACYALHAYKDPAVIGLNKPAQWPWDAKWWKPKDPRRNLVRAAALILAEIDRLDRAAAAESKKLSDKVFGDWP